MNFGASGGIGHVAQQMIPVYGLVNTYKKAKALEKAGKIRGNGASHVVGQIASNMASNLGERIGFNPDNSHEKQVLGHSIGLLGKATTVARAATVGSRFQDLINEKTDAYMRKHPGADRDSIRKKIKSRLYHEGEVDLGKIKDD